MGDSKREIWERAVAAFEQGAHALLEGLCRDYLDLDAGSFPIRMLLAHALVKMKRFAEAAELLEAANPSDERSVILWHRTAGDYYGERGDYEAAEDEYASALALADEPTTDLVLDLVDAMVNQGKAAAAVAAVDAFLTGRESVEDGDLLAFARARALRNLGRYREARAAVTELGEVGVDFADARTLIAELDQRIARDQARACEPLTGGRPLPDAE